MERCYYVYIITDPETSQPFYIGKGRDDRMMYHERAALGNWCDSDKPHHDKIREMYQRGKRPSYCKFLDNVTETVALNKERELIEMYGRVNNGTGILLNLSAGGSNSGSHEKSVSQYTMDSRFIATHSSVKRASEQVTGANRSYITQCCKKKRKSAGGFLWVYEGDDVPTYTHEYHRSVCQYSPLGKLLHTYKCLTDAARAVGVDVRTISKACAGMSKSSAGFFWRYADEQFELGTPVIHLTNRPIQQLTMCGKPVRTFDSINDAARSVGVSGTRIKQVCDNKPGANSSCGFIWKYAN